MLHRTFTIFASQINTKTDVKASAEAKWVVIRMLYRRRAESMTSKAARCGLGIIGAAVALLAYLSAFPTTPL
jgi:hypothetical protein